MEDILVERNFDEPIDFDNFEGLAQKAPWCIELNKLTHLGTYIHPNNKDMYCHYRAPDADSFRAPSREHDVHFTRAWTARVTGLVTPADVVRLLCPDDFDNEPKPSIVCAYGSSRDAVAVAELARTAPGRHLMTYQSANDGRVLMVFEHTNGDALRAHLDGFVIHEAVVRLRHLRSS